MSDPTQTTSPSLSMTLDEAYELNRYHQAHEKAAAASGDYDKAKAHKERAAEIGSKFWPADAWERAWSAKNG